MLAASCGSAGCGGGSIAGDANAADTVIADAANPALAQQAYVKASNTNAGDHFGEKVALSADGNTLAVGTFYEASSATGIGGDQTDNSAPLAGAVYVFARVGATWNQQAYVKASNTERGDYFGWSVALSADGSTLAVGAILEDSAATGIDGNQADNSAPAVGAAYMFARVGTTWSQQAYVKASNTAGGFGHSVALSADGGTLAVGAPFEDSAATGIDGNQTDSSANASGAVYMFTRAGTTWSQRAYVKASNTGVGDDFGDGVALSADGNTLAVSAVYEDSAATGIGGDQADNSALQSGAVYVFARVAAAWSQQAYVKASNTEAGAYDPNTGLGEMFGAGVALSADSNTLAIAMPIEASAATGIDGNQADNSAYGSGAVYVFTREGTTWSQQAYVKASNAQAGDYFGNLDSVALSADGGTLAVGAPSEDSAATGIDGNQADNSADSSGAVYMFARRGTTWSQQAYVKASNAGTSDQFGIPVALSADGRTLAVSASWEASAATGIGGNQADNSATQSGAVYVFR